jgi:hypothetical protein
MQNPPENLRSALFARRASWITEAAFYRVYPYCGRLDVRYVDLRGMCGLNQGFFYSRVPKAANSTVSVYLAEQCGGPAWRARQRRDLCQDRLSETQPAKHISGRPVCGPLQVHFRRQSICSRAVGLFGQGSHREEDQCHSVFHRILPLPRQRWTLSQRSLGASDKRTWPATASLWNRSEGLKLTTTK